MMSTKIISFLTNTNNLINDKMVAKRITSNFLLEQIQIFQTKMDLTIRILLEVHCVILSKKTIPKNKVN